jgi:uncharacterized protein with HEPN domain
MRDDRERVLDILEAIERIERHSADGRGAFDAGELVQIWVTHHLLIIGEACRGLTQTLKQKHSEIPWQEIVGMRNILVHQYFGVDKDAVWSVVVHDLPQLKRWAQQTLPEL